MSSHPNAEFAQFRFVRDGSGNPVVLPSQGIDERNLLVIDYERWGLARLHIFEEAAVRKDKLEAFQEELAALSELRSKTLTRLVSWGRDGEELFYSDEMLDGEPMPDYLGRTGGVPVAVAGEWMMQIIKLLKSVPDELPSFQRFTTLNFQIILDSRNEVRPVFSEFFGWTKPGAQVREHAREWHLAQIFCSLIAGVPVRTFHDSSLPRNFDDLESRVQSAVLDALSDGRPGAYDTFVKEMKRLSGKSVAVRDETALPELTVREWLRTELANSYSGDPEYVLPEGYARDEERYGLESSIRGSESIVQLMPGPEYIPREGWLNQHHLATRRVGKAMLHQLHVNYIEDREQVTLIGEERLSGVDLGSLIREVGKLKPEVVARIGVRLGGVLTALEGKVGSCAVWWLPPENILFRTGTRSLKGSAGLVERKGAEIWDELPVKLRLHQTAKTLRTGVNLPASVRALSKDPGKSNAESRRHAVALPVLFFLLTGERFRWKQTVGKQARLPKEIGRFLEEARLTLVDDPETIEDDLFLEFSRLVEGMENTRAEPVVEVAEEAPASVAQAETEPGVAIESEIPDPAPGSHEEEFRKTLEGMLYQGKIELRTDEGKPKPPPQDRPETPVEESVDVDEAVGDGENPPLTPKKSRWKFWSAGNVWAAFWAIVISLVTGYFLSGWNAEQGRFEIHDRPGFPMVTLPEKVSVSWDSVGQKLEAYLIESGRPDLIPSVSEQEGLPAGPAMAFLQEQLEEFDRDAFGIIADIAFLTNDPEKDRKLLRAAEYGDPSSQICVARAVLIEGSELTDEATARKLLETAALQSPQGALLLASLQFQAGEGDLAEKTIQPAIDAGIPFASYQLGLFRAHAGNPEAAPAFKKAAELGDWNAMTAWAKCLECGYGVEPSFTEATRWMKLAASAKVAEAEKWCASRRIGTDLAGQP